MKKLLFIPVVLMLFGSCATLDQALGGILGSGGGLTSAETSSGLKEALTRGITLGADVVSQKDGFFKNELIKVLFPPKVQKVQEKLEMLGFGSLTDNLVMKMNRAAEDAAKSSKPIFVAAIREMTIQDAMGILMGEDNAATDYLRRTTSDELNTAFYPVVNRSMEKLQVIDTWENVIDKYNKIPFMEPVEQDINQYVTDKAMFGLFHMIEKEEMKIRKDPGARVTALLQKVFAAQDNK